MSSRRAEDVGGLVSRLPPRHRRLQADQRPARPPGRRPRALRRSSTRLRQGGEAFRLGGDEFALLLPGVDEAAALAVARSVVKRIGESGLGQYGVDHRQRRRRDVPAARPRARRADPARRRRALLGEGARQEPGAARGQRPSPRSSRSSRSIGDRLARFRAAAALARAVDSRDVYTGSHSERVARDRGRDRRAARRCPPTEIELTRLAGSLHDLGKLAIPEEILQKPGELTSAEWLVVAAASADRAPDAREPRRRAGGRLGAPPPRALGRHRLSRRARRRGHPARLAHRLRRRGRSTR